MKILNLPVRLIGCRIMIARLGDHSRSRRAQFFIAGDDPEKLLYCLGILPVLV